MRSGIAGLVLAAGAGRRWMEATESGVEDGTPADDTAASPSPEGGPKLLLTDAEGTTLLAHAIRSLTEAGCDPVLVVVGTHDERVRAELRAIVDRGAGADLRLVECPTWEHGLGESLRTGLSALPGVVDDHPGTDVDSVVITLADLPEQGPELVRRLLTADPRGEGALARTTFAGRPGHPVLLGRDRWSAAARQAHDDVGARDLLRSPGTVVVESGDLSSGTDVDHPADLASVSARWGVRSAPAKLDG
ncbi:nucleotidyltransferase family protein [Mobilicoccus caccae]|uniref:MobA-like NTP transferase domain-containing protein n=1 Tax=Mobilicoccus caccae TaxID=1859295 RepID=A0ABQ6ITV4_9MICO|nr:nucleotidyltransferase family protein [Mobilicoccus caccae]GMA41350.1 hypothetical protein GCM10025883_33950 [Mobilicoccus caccae]